MAKRQKYRELSVETHIPIYGGKLHLVVANDLTRAREKWNDRLGEAVDDLTGCPAFLERSRRRSIYVLFIEFGWTRNDIIAHEVFHVTCRVMEYNSVYLRPDNHEAHAHFHGWATAWVYESLHKLGVRVTRKCL